MIKKEEVGKVMIEERFILAKERIAKIKEEKLVKEEFLDYFQKVALFIEMLCAYYGDIEIEKEKTLKEWEKENASLYEDIVGEHYLTSYVNPAYSVEKVGEEYGVILATLFQEIRTIISFCYENKKESMVILMELFLEIYGQFTCAYEAKGEIPQYAQIKDSFYWYLLDYSDDYSEMKIYEQVNPKYEYFTSKILANHFSDYIYLYQTGEYVTEIERKTAQYIHQLPMETIRLMAETFTQGYKLGFAATQKDISIKSSVSIVYPMGFERVIKEAILMFQEMGLKTCIRRRSTMLSGGVSGYSGHIPNKQCDYDHKNDEGLFLDKLYVQRKLEALKASFANQKVAAGLYGGPAVMGVFGEEPFSPSKNQFAVEYNKEQQELLVEYKREAVEIQNQYIKQEERSFTIIAFPIPEIGENFEEIFDEIIKVNTLDNEKYQQMQQILIDVLDTATHVEIIGGNGNKTNLKVALQEIKDDQTETKFENCVADVNIPVGEVFTSPQLKGTTGKLHVSQAFLHELEYKQLEIDFQDGFTTSYTCENFSTIEENQAYIKENILCHHDAAPMGEFAIGTNTMAYMVAQKYNIHQKLPVLIAEKMGPHFAIGDTCYSHAEKLAMYNPNGKEVIARGNELTNYEDKSQNKYFNCHTDITIPYDELEVLRVIKNDGSSENIIVKGRFVLEGLELLNEPFDGI